MFCSGLPLITVTLTSPPCPANVPVIRITGIMRNGGHSRTHWLCIYKNGLSYVYFSPFLYLSFSLAPPPFSISSCVLVSLYCRLGGGIYECCHNKISGFLLWTEDKGDGSKSSSDIDAACFRPSAVSLLYVLCEAELGLSLQTTLSTPQDHLKLENSTVSAVCLPNQ